MPIETDLNISPYYDDYDENKNYHRILFKPAVPLQARELTQLQTILQTQVERFGDFQFKEGTIVKGCAFSFDSSVKYAKILDRSPDTNLNVNLDAYAKEDYLRHEGSNLVSQIVDTRAGLEATDPDLATLFFHYINTGNNSGTVKTAYANSDVLTVIPKYTSINAISVTDAGEGVFDVNDKVYVTSAGNTGTGFVGAVQTVSSNVITAIVVDGETSNGRSQGTGYSLLDYPYVSQIKRGESVIWNTTSHSGNGVLIGTYANGHSNTITLPVALTQTAKTTIAGAAFTAPVGSSYQMHVADGIVYQRGAFQKFDEQSIIVSPYTRVPDQLSVGIITNEVIANSSVDTSLLDNAAGFNNENAPGADRLKLTPVLTVNTTANARASNNFLSFVEFQNGNRVMQNQTPVLNRSEDHIARRTFEESGDYVLDPIRVTTETNAGNTTHINVLVGEGVGYVQGQRFETLDTTRFPIPKATTTQNVASHTITTAFGSYVNVNEAIGNFGVDTQAEVKLLRTNLNAISGGMATSGSSNATHIIYDGTNSEIIGTAKIRGMELESGIGGTANSNYQMYLFDISMNAGRQFQDVQAIGRLSGSAVKGVADIVGSRPNLIDSERSAAVFPIGAKALKGVKGTASAVVKVVKTAQISGTDSNTSISAGSGNTFNFGSSATLTSLQEGQVTIIAKTDATGADIASAGAVVTGTNTMVTGCGDTSSLIAGDNIKVGSNVRQVTQVVNSTAIVVNEALGAASSLTVKRAFVNNHIIPLGGRTSANASTSADGSTLTINFGTGNLSSAVDVDILVDVVDPTSGGLKKGLNVSAVKINPASNTSGPWCLGIPDGQKILAVHLGTGSSYNTSGADIKDDFILDNGQKDSKYGLSYLKLKPGSGRTIASTDRLIVMLKHFEKDTSTGSGFYTMNSYDAILNDKEGAGVAASNSNISIAEIPVFVSPTDGRNISLRDAVDFRPYANTTANTGQAVGSSNITENPAEDNKLSSTGLLTPTPNEDWIDEIEFYLPRRDRVVMEQRGTTILKGVPSLNPELPTKPKKSMQIATIDVPAYPTMDTGNAKFFGRPDLGAKVKASQQRRFTMKDIGKLEKRIDNLEYYSSLNALESLTVDQTIPGRNDATTNRFKNGFLVDNFTTKTAGNPLNAEYKAGFDVARQLLTPKFEQYNIDLKPKLADSRNSQQQGDLFTQSYVQKKLLEQSTATGTRRCTSMFWEYNGTLKLYPDYVNHHDKTTAPELAMDIDLDMSADTLAMIEELNKILPSVVVSSEVISEDSKKDLVGSVTEGLTTTDTYETVITTKTKESTKKLAAEVNTTTKKIGDYVTDISFQPYMPAMTIHFTATGLRPNLKHYVYFDGVNVTATSKWMYNPSVPMHKIYNNVLGQSAEDYFFPRAPIGTGFTSDDKGQVSGHIKIPAGKFFTGKAEVVVTDIDDLSKIGEKVSHAKAYFNCFNWSTETAEVNLTTREALITSSTSSRVVTTKDRQTEQVITTEDPPAESNTSANTGTVDDDEGRDNGANTTVGDGNTTIGANTTNSVSNASSNAVSGPSLGRCEIVDPCEREYYYRDNWHYVAHEGGYHHHHYRPYYDPLCCFDVRGVADPLAQTFMVPRSGLPEGSPQGFLSKLDLYFSEKDPNTGIVIEIRETRNGVPGAKVLPFSRVHLRASDVNVSSTGTAKTVVEFESPVAVEAGTEYTVVMLPDGNSPNYSVFTSKAGGTDLRNASKQVNNDWGTGTMFLSTNNRTWTEYLDEDIKFAVYCCVFTKAKSAVVLENKDYEWLTLESGNTITGSFVAGGEVFKQASAQTGTVTFAIDSTALTGSGTNFASTYAAGDRIVLQANATGTGANNYDIVTVSTVNSDTSITLKGTPNFASGGSAKTIKTPTGIFSYLDPITKTSQIEFSTATSSSFAFANGDILMQAGVYNAGDVPNFKIGEVANHELSYVQPQIGRLETNDTTVTTKIRASKVGAVTSKSNYQALKLNDNNFLNDKVLVMSRSNEIRDNSGNKSLEIRHILSSDIAGVSPVVDLQNQSIKIYENNINNDATNEHITFKGNADTKYVSRVITLAKDLDAEDIKVFVNAYRPSGTDVKVYAKILNQADGTTIDNAVWSELECTKNANRKSSSVDRLDVVEYTYEFKDTLETTAKAGQLIATSGSADVTGAGTAFSTDYADGDLIKIVNLDDQTDYQINRVLGTPGSATTMTLAEPMAFNQTGAVHSKVDAKELNQAFRDPQAANAGEVTYYNTSGERFRGYKRMAIKIVMLSDSKTKTPAIKDYRAIALSL